MCTPSRSSTSRGPWRSRCSSAAACGPGTTATTRWSPPDSSRTRDRASACPPELPRRPVATTLARTLRALRQGRHLPGARRGVRRAARPAAGDAERLGTLAAALPRFPRGPRGPGRRPRHAPRGRGRGSRPGPVAGRGRGAHRRRPRARPGGARLRRRPGAASARAPPATRGPPGPAAVLLPRVGGGAGDHGGRRGDETRLAPLVPPPPARGARPPPPRSVRAADRGRRSRTARWPSSPPPARPRRCAPSCAGCSSEAARGVPFEEMGVVLPRPETYAAAVHRPPRAAGSPSPPAPVAASALRPLRALAAAAPPLSRDSPAPRSWSSSPSPRCPSASSSARGGPAAPTVGRPQPRRRRRLGSRPLDDRAPGLRGGRARSGGEGERGAPRAQRTATSRTRRRSSGWWSLLSATLDSLSGSEPWPTWSERLRTVCEEWIGPEPTPRSVLERDRRSRGPRQRGRPGVVGGGRAGLEARLEWERLPLEPVEGGALHVGALDAMAGLTFRVVAIPGLVEGGYPGVLRPDPFLLDGEREALEAGAATPEPKEEPRKTAAPPARPAQERGTDEPVRRRGRDGRGDDEAGRDARRPLRHRSDEGRPTAGPRHHPGPSARGAAALPPRGLAGHREARPLLPPRRRPHRTRATARRSSSPPPPPRSRAGLWPGPTSSAWSWRTTPPPFPSKRPSTPASGTGPACGPATGRRPRRSPPGPRSSSSRASPPRPAGPAG